MSKKEEYEGYIKAQHDRVKLFKIKNSLSDSEFIMKWMVSDERDIWKKEYLNNLGVKEEDQEKYSKKWNYCSGGPDSWGGVYLGKVCERHDLSYSFKGNRKENDKNLRKGIREEIKRNGNWFIRKTAGFVSFSFYTVVRTVGWEFKNKKKS